MASRNKIVKFLNDKLKVKEIKDKSRNGLQFKGRNEVEKIGFSVDCSIRVIEMAHDKKCDMLIVHHGYKWRGKSVLNLRSKYEKLLKKYDMNLCGYHLPLDMHPKLGNNAIMCELLGLKKLKTFGGYHGQYVGFNGERNIKFTDLVKLVRKHINKDLRIVDAGKKNLKRIGIVSGGSGKMWMNERKAVDAYICGEMTHGTSNKARDIGFNIIEAGHYKTEVFGVKALMPILKDKFDVEVEFLDAPTGF